jgi:hypothetical protein
LNCGGVLSTTTTTKKEAFFVVSGFGESDWEIAGSDFEMYGKKTQRELYKWFQLNGSNMKDYYEGLGRFQKTTFFFF